MEDFDKGNGLTIKNRNYLKTWGIVSNVDRMEKEEIFAMFLLFKKYGMNAILNCMQGICMALNLEEDPQLLLDYANAVQQQEEVVYCFLQYTTSYGEKDKDVSVAFGFVETGTVMKKNEHEIGNIGTCEGAVQTGY